jgi:large subunit ribosomal protein L10
VKREKKIFLEEIRQQVGNSESFLIANYERLSAEQSHQFRQRLREVGGYFEVVRKRLFVKAAEDLGISFDVSDFPGHVGLVLGMDDTIQAAKVVKDFNKGKGEPLRFLGGYVDGERVSKADVERLSTLPGKDQMRAQLLSLLVGPMTQFVGVCDSLLSSVVRCVDQRCQKESE